MTTSTSEHQEKSIKEKNLFQRHNLFLSIFGMFIVFATYLIKEGIHEELKDQLDAIKSAETVYLIRRDNSWAEVSQIVEKWVYIDDLFDAVKKKDQPIALMKIAEKEKILIQETENAIDSSFSNFTDFVNAAQQYEPSTDFGQISTSAVREGVLLRSQLGPSIDLSKFGDYERSADSALKQNDEVAAKILEDLETKVRVNERYLKAANTASYVLYVVGWCLGLVGRIFGTEIATSE